MDLENTIRKIQATRPALEAQGVKHIGVFGSRARGSEKPDSDLDVLVDIDPATKFSLLDLIAVERIVSKKTGLRVQALASADLQMDIARRIAQDLRQVF